MPARLPASPTPIAAAGILIMLAAIATAWAFQLAEGFVPCELCLAQREPYYIAIPVAALGLLVLRRAPLAGRALLLAGAAAMVWAAALGAYHAGVEWGAWQGPNTCGAATDVTDAATLIARMQGETLVSCTAAAGRFLGLSFAGWNVLAATAAALTLAAAVLLPVRPRGIA